ncbi:unknown [Oscillibacter sp. CAG:155]|nr:unknown [Oscillibacter sp. CAG:155]
MGVHLLQGGGEHDVGIALGAVVILVHVAADQPNTVGLLGSSEGAVARVACGHEQHVATLGDQSVTHNLAGSLVREVADVVAAHVVAGQIHASIGGQLHALSRGAIVLVGVVHAGHKAILIVHVGGISHAVDHGHLVGLGLHGSGHTSKEAALLLGEGHGVDVVQGHGIAFTVGDGGVHHDEIGVGVGRSHIAHIGEVESGQDEHVVIAYHALHRGNQLIVVGLLHVGDGAVRMIRQEGLDTLVAVLVERTVINTGGGNDADLQTGCGIVVGRITAVFLSGVRAAAGRQGQEHRKGQAQCRQLFA